MEPKTLGKAPGSIAMALFLALAIVIGAPSTARAEPVGETALYFLENPYTGECFFTTSRDERDAIAAIGWRYDWIPMFVPTASDHPVYRLYNPYNDDHLYTQGKQEYDTLATVGWRQEGIAFYSSDEPNVAMYRIYDPGETGPGAHSYSTDRDWCLEQGRYGWKFEDDQWYGSRRPSSIAEKYQGAWYAGRFWPDFDEPGDPSGSPVDPNPPSDGEGRQDVLEFARRYLGYPYHYAGHDPSTGFDCSGFTQWVFHNFGVELPGTTWGQIDWLRERGRWKTDVEDLMPGDLVFIEYGGHAAIFAGKDPDTGRYMMIDAPNPGKTVSEREIYALYPGAFSGYSFEGGGSVL